MLYFTGDLHGKHDIHKLNTKNFKEQKELNKNDYLLIAGDFGLVWYNSKHPKYNDDEYQLKQLNDRNFTTLFIPGNHENYELLYSGIYPEIDMFGDKVLKIKDSIFMLQTGRIYTIDGKRIFTFGGAMSVDMLERVPYVSWWPQEIPSYSQMKDGLDNLKKIDNNVDVIISHATHQTMFDCLGLNSFGKEKDPVKEYLTEVQRIANYSFWVNGHYHCDMINKKSKTITMYYAIHSYDNLQRIFNE